MVYGWLVVGRGRVDAYGGFYPHRYIRFWMDSPEIKNRSRKRYVAMDACGNPMVEGLSGHGLLAAFGGLACNATRTNARVSRGPAWQDESTCTAARWAISGYACREELGSPLYFTPWTTESGDPVARPITIANSGLRDDATSRCSPRRASRIHEEGCAEPSQRAFAPLGKPSAGDPLRALSLSLAADNARHGG